MRNCVCTDVGSKQKNMNEKNKQFAFRIVGYVKAIYVKHSKIALDSKQAFEEIGTEKEKYLKRVFTLYMKGYSDNSLRGSGSRSQVMQSACDEHDLISDTSDS